MSMIHVAAQTGFGRTGFGTDRFRLQVDESNLVDKIISHGNIQIHQSHRNASDCEGAVPYRHLLN